MVMENPFEGKEIWFGVGSQDLYGEEAPGRHSLR